MDDKAKAYASLSNRSYTHETNERTIDGYKEPALATIICLLVLQFFFLNSDNAFSDVNPLVDNYISIQDFSSPLILDLNNNNKTSTSLMMSSTHFDFNGDGFAERTGWIEREDGLLALDKNRDGIINNGSELFGNYTLKKAGKTAKNGFEALADHDDNKNGVLNTDDNIYDSLKIWVDKNRDGISQKVELHNLADLNIKSINLNADKINIKEKWNKISHEADFTQQVISETGNPVFVKKKIRDVWLATDKQDTKYIYAGVLPKDITILPDMKGKGWVKNLSYAMAEDNDLEQLVKSFLTNRASDLADLYSQADEILASWTHTNDIDPDKARGKQYILNHNYANPKIKGVFRVYAKAREVAILENFAGKKFQMKVDGKTTDKVSSSKTAWAVRIKYDYLRDTLMINLLAQSLFGKDIYNLKTAKLKKNAWTLLQNKLLSPANANEQQTAVNLFSSFLNRNHLAVFNKLDPQVLNNTAIRNMLNNNGISLSLVNSNEVSGTILDKQFGTNASDTLSGSTTIYGQKGNDILIGSNGHDVLFGGKGDDVLKGGHGSDILYGGDGNDTIIAGGHYGHDILEGGEGNDTLKGNTRASTYVYKYGHGHDIISDSGSIGKTPDVLILNGLARNNIKLEKQGNDLILKIRAYPKLDSYKFGSVLIKDCFGKGRIERFQFKDQTLNFNQLLSN